MAITEDAVKQALSTIMDPDLGKDIVTLGFVKNVAIDGTKVSATIELTTPACPVKEQLKTQAEENIKALEGVTEVAVEMTAQVAGMAGRAGRNVMPGVRHIVAVASGKGGVGKSTSAVNLAVALSRTGARVGLLDGDLYGPSSHTILGAEAQLLGDKDGRILPISKYDIKIVSMGLLRDSGAPVVWRGPIASRVIQQFLGGVEWGELDYLLIDLPPGTGDIQLTLAQSAPLSGAVIVTTPQPVATNVAQKGLRMFQQVEVPILGVLENMSGFVCGHCGEVTDVFQKDGGRRMAEEIGVPLLAQIPLSAELAAASDEGVPVAYKAPDSIAANAFATAAREIARQLAIREKGGEAGPQSITPDENAAELAITWADGAVDRLPYTVLRGNCPCAECVDEMTGKRQFDETKVKADINLLSFHPVGNYAILIKWSDGHETGIFSWPYLRELARRLAA